ncbi:MAG: hypothetical protein INR62_03085 [Rhodospirillales bacterium]|nr:hypothetical protein [Acetobacter sp.]
MNRFRRDHAVAILPLPKTITRTAVLSASGRLPLCRVPFDHRRNGVRETVYQMARHLRREMGYDFVPYSTEHQSTRDCAYVFAVRADVDCYFAVGGCSFHWIDWENAEPGFSMTWAWLHPHFRHQGHLGKAWPYFREHYGNFYVEYPHSAAMSAFLQKIGHVQPTARDAPQARDQ